MTEEFAVGDMVECIDAGYRGEALTLGKRYKITKYSPGSIGFYIKDNRNVEGAYLKSGFRRVQTTTDALRQHYEAEIKKRDDALAVAIEVLDDRADLEIPCRALQRIGEILK